MTTNIICLGCKKPKYKTICCRYQADMAFSSIKKSSFNFSELEKYLGGSVTFDLPARYKEKKDV